MSHPLWLCKIKEKFIKLHNLKLSEHEAEQCVE